MHIAVPGKQLEVGDALRGHVEDRITAGAEKYFGNPIDAQVVFSREGSLHRVDCSVHVGAGIHVEAYATAEDAYASFDTAPQKEITAIQAAPQESPQIHTDRDGRSPELRPFVRRGTRRSE